MRSEGIIERVPFTTEMKKTHKILIPMMLPIHFDMIAKVLEQDGYTIEVLKTNHKGIAEEGLRSVHNDTCYPALLVIGQFLDALKSGEYDTDHVALLITQTGGGCRASNYIYLLRKALKKNGFGHVPVVSVNFSGLEENSGFQLTGKVLVKMVFSIMYADFLMCLHNQCVPYEVNKGDTQAVVDRWTAELLKRMSSLKFTHMRSIYREILADFAKIPLDRSRETVKVGIVGEIYLKYAPLGNNDLEQYLVSEGAEVINSGLMDFIQYWIYNVIHDKSLYGKRGFGHYGMLVARKFVYAQQVKMINEIKRHGVFTPPTDFKEIIHAAEGYIDRGVKMGEGWLLTAEMVELIRSGVNNIVTAQPFGCLPNHIVAKGMIRKIKDNYPDSNIVAVDYDPGASRINQENRIKLMLSNAKMGQGLAQIKHTGKPVEVLEEAQEIFA